jgi:hypothetical protein
VVIIDFFSRVLSEELLALGKMAINRKVIKLIKMYNLTGAK